MDEIKFPLSPQNYLEAEKIAQSCVPGVGAILWKTETPTFGNNVLMHALSLGTTGVNTIFIEEHLLKVTVQYYWMRTGYEL